MIITERTILRSWRNEDLDAFSAMTADPEVMTDSGGLQKEAFFFQKHCITLREQTEWVELVEHDFNKVVGSDEEKIQNAFEYFRNKKSDFNINLYGNGKASEVIAETLLQKF